MGVECEAHEGEGKGKAGVLVVGSGVRGAWNCAQGRKACGLGEAPGAVTLAGRDAGRMKALALRRWGGAKAGAKKASEKVECELSFSGNPNQ